MENIHQCSVLVLESRPLQRKAVISRLREFSIGSVYEATNSTEATRILDTRPVDLVLCGLEAPLFFGLDFVKQLIDTSRNVAVAFILPVDRSVLDCVTLMAGDSPTRFVGTLEKPKSSANLRSLLAAAAAPAASTADTLVRPLNEVRAAFNARELVAYFQPIVDGTTGELRGAEALARWNHPTRGVLTPGHFLPAMEATDDTNALTWLILDDALKFVRSLQAVGHSAMVSVNLSSGFLSRPGVAAAIADRVENNDVRASLIGFEVSAGIEGVTSRDCLGNLARLRLRGHAIATSNFGTAFGTLQQLTRVPFQIMKFPRSFLHEAMRERRSWALLQSSVAMARALDMTTVVEGVETDKACRRLRKINADLHQGFYYGRPMSAERFLDRLKPTKPGRITALRGRPKAPRPNLNAVLALREAGLSWAKVATRLECSKWAARQVINEAKQAREDEAKTDSPAPAPPAARSGVSLVAGSLDAGKSSAVAP